MQKLKNLVTALAAVLALACPFAVIGREFFALYLVLTAAVIAGGFIRLPSWLRPPLDLSYAIYLYAFPVQQLSAMLTNNFWLGLFFSAVATALLALLSALFVEQPAQRLKLAWRRSISLDQPRLTLAGSGGPTEAETA